MSGPTRIVSEQRLMAAGWVNSETVSAGRAVKFLSSEYPNGYRHRDQDMVKGEGIPETSTPHLEEVREMLEAKLAQPLCRVGGVEVVELALLIKPTAFLVTTANGTHEINRCYFQSGAFAFGVDMKRIGGIAARSVEYFPERGLYLHLEKGYEMFIPSSHCSATWRLPEP
jgi:hypothetical protein